MVSLEYFLTLGISDKIKFYHQL